MEWPDDLLRRESRPFPYSRSSPVRNHEPRCDPFPISCNDHWIIRIKFDPLYRDTSTYLRSDSLRLSEQRFLHLPMGKRKERRFLRSGFHEVSRAKAHFNLRNLFGTRSEKDVGNAE